MRCLHNFLIGRPERPPFQRLPSERPRQRLNLVRTPELGTLLANCLAVSPDLVSSRLPSFERLLRVRRHRERFSRILASCVVTDFPTRHRTSESIRTISSSSRAARGASASGPSQHEQPRRQSPGPRVSRACGSDDRAGCSHTRRPTATRRRASLFDGASCTRATRSTTPMPSVPNSASGDARSTAHPRTPPARPRAAALRDVFAEQHRRRAARRARLCPPPCTSVVTSRASTRCASRCSGALARRASQSAAIALAFEEREDTSGSVTTSRSSVFSQN